MITKKHAWLTGAVISATIIGSYIFYRKQKGDTNSVLDNIKAGITPPSIADDLSVQSTVTLSRSTAKQGQNVASSLGDTYLDYNTDGTIELHTGATTGDGNSLNQGIPGQSLYNTQLQALIQANPLLAPTATAVQAPRSYIDWNVVSNPPLPN